MSIFQGLKVPWIGLAFVLACAAAPSFVGHSTKELYEKLGPPDQVIDDPACAGCKIHVYTRDEHRVWQDPATETTSLDPDSLNGLGLKTETTPGKIHSSSSRHKTIYYADANGIITVVKKK
jgi:hypothetical protein